MRTKVQERQQKLWQELGTLHRTAINLENIRQDLSVHPSDKQILRRAAGILRALQLKNLKEMRTLPSKKNLARAQRI